MELNINSDALVIHTNKLEKMHRSALPVAVRNSLNNVAFDVKQRTLPSQVKKDFVNRNKTFFKATSRVSMASGFDVRTMQSIVGFIGGEKNQAVRDLEQQERGGTIGGRSFIPMKSARSSSSNSKLVRKDKQLNRIKNINTVRDRKDFFKQVVKSGVGGFIIHKNTLFQVKRIARGNIKLDALYSYEKSRSVKVKSTEFMQTASLTSNKRMETYFKINARKQFNKLR